MSWILWLPLILGQDGLGVNNTPQLGQPAVNLSEDASGTKVRGLELLKL